MAKEDTRPLGPLREKDEMSAMIFLLTISPPSSSFPFDMNGYCAVSEGDRLGEVLEICYTVGAYIAL